jgi:hypothetical protein
MHINETLDFRGEVVITAISDSGTEVLVNDKNLIVLNGRKKVAQHMLSGSGAYISDIYFGSNGTAVGDPNQIKPVLPTEMTITPIPSLIVGEDYTFTVDSSSLAISDARPKLVYIINIPKLGTSLNSKSINELALMLSTNPVTAFAIKRFATIVKSESIALNITWTIYF